MAFGVYTFWHLQLGSLTGFLLVGATVWAWNEVKPQTIAKLWIPYLVLGLPNIILALRLTRSAGSEEASSILRTVAPQQYEPWTTDHRLMIAFAAALAFGIAGVFLHQARVHSAKQQCWLPRQ